MNVKALAAQIATLGFVVDSYRQSIYVYEPDATALVTNLQVHESQSLPGTVSVTLPRSASLALFSAWADALGIGVYVTFNEFRGCYVAHVYA